jgi:3',5'-cyclic AMP phosphodiesterase CpdA
MASEFRRILLLSDPHFDFATREKTRFFTRERVDVDAIVVAGDVANNEMYASAFFELWESYDCPKYAVPGNHDLWWSEGAFEHRPGRDPSLWDVARRQRFTVPDPDALWQVVDGILLFGLWYPDRLREWNGPFTNDYEYFDVEKRIRDLEPPEDPVTVRLSVSHMSPNPRIPSGFKERSPLFYHEGMDAILRSHRSALHLYGHTHEPRDIQVDGVRYVNRTVGYDDMVHRFRSLEEFVVEL